GRSRDTAAPGDPCGRTTSPSMSPRSCLFPAPRPVERLPPRTPPKGEGPAPRRGAERGVGSRPRGGRAHLSQGGSPAAAVRRGRRTRPLLQIFLEEGQGALQRRLVAFLVEVRPLVAAEAVACRVDVDRHLGVGGAYLLDIGHRDMRV